MNEVKSIELNKKERELIKIAEHFGYKQWGYKTWRMKRIIKGKSEEYVLTKSVANKGEWSLVQKFSLGDTKVKTTTKDIERLILILIL